MEVTNLPVNKTYSLTRGTVKIGNTLFVDGSPHHECNICGSIYKAADAPVSVYGRRDGKVAERKPYKATVLYGWTAPEPDIRVVNGYPENVAKSAPIVKQVECCFACWNRQQDAKARYSRLAEWCYKPKAR